MIILSGNGPITVISFCPRANTSRQGKSNVGLCSSEPVRANKFLSVIAYTTVPIFAQYKAPAHIAQGSAVVYRVQFHKNSLLYYIEALSINCVSACPVVLCVEISTFSCSIKILPSASIDNAPNGVLPTSHECFEISIQRSK